MGLRQLAAYRAKLSGGLETPFQFAGVPVSGVGGTMAGRAQVGSKLTDYTNGKDYICTAATATSVTWVLTGGQV
jgi:hypothetical protein